MKKNTSAMRWIALMAVGMLASTSIAQQIEPLDAERQTPVVRIFQRAKDAVVNISTTRVVKTRTRFFGFRDDSRDDVFLSPFARNVPVKSLGSGFIIHPDGYIVTNEHVVRRAMKITVYLADKTKLPAKVIAADPTHDLAILKVSAPADKKLPALPLGRSDDLMIGETVIAIGNPHGYRHSVTAGVISALNRELRFRGNVEYKGLIQTDASINRGNSGGPLLNVKAEVIGVNTAIRPDAQGISFAIAVNDLTKDLPHLLDFRRLNRVIVGMEVAPQPGQRHRLMVTKVEAGSPAAKAGVKVGQAIAAVDGRPVTAPAGYYVHMLSKKGGDALALKVLDGDKPATLTLRLAARPEPDGKSLARNLLGVTVAPITPALARRMRLPTSRGLLVTGVVQGSPAHEIGIQVRDVLFQVGSGYVVTLDDLGRALEDVRPGQVLRIGIGRGYVRAWTNVRTAEGDR